MHIQPPATLLMGPPKTLKEIFSNVHVDAITECWNWLGVLDHNGYAFPTIARRAWIFKNGRQMDEGRLACHTCDNRLCVNPEHIYPGTPGDNIKDTWVRTRKAPRRLVQKLTNEQVAEIKRMNNRSARFLGRQFGVSHATISKIRRGFRFTDIEAAT